MPPQRGTVPSTTGSAEEPVEGGGEAEEVDPGGEEGQGHPDRGDQERLGDEEVQDLALLRPGQAEQGQVAAPVRGRL